MPIKPKKGPSLKKKKASGPLIVAKNAVALFEKERDLLVAMRGEFEEKFPEANEFMQNIMEQEDLVQDKVKEAIPLIREARQDVGDFKCQLKRTTANYDDKEFISLVAQIEEGGDILIELIEEGYVKKLDLDPSAANYFAQHPDAAEHFQSAWKDSVEMTPAITAPKF